jgi:diketogulonate reductase-like aldo/keto reductase
MPDACTASPALVSLADTVEIAPGVAINRLGLGTYRADEGPDVEREVRYGLDLGYRTIDTAALYGNEHSVGKAMRRSGVAREDVFVTTKLWNDDQGYESALRAFDISLERLGFDYVDLYLVHWPRDGKMRDTWRAMEEILASGRTRAIGVCNFLVHHLNSLSALANVAPALNQIEHHPRLQQPGLVAHCQELGIAVQAWAPIMRGKVMLVPEIVQIAQAHRKTPAQVTLRWILQRGVITIPKSVHERRIAENADIYDFELSSAEMAIIDSLDRGERIGPDPDNYG